MRATVFVAASADGFIARSDGSLDWLTASAAGDNDYGFSDLLSSVDALVMGRNTFDFVMSSGQWGYEDKLVVVLTHRPLELPDGFEGHVEASDLSPTDLVATLTERGIDHIYVDGGNTVQQFLRAGLIAEIIVTQIPVLIGSGISLYGQLEGDLPLRLVRAQAFDNGWVQYEYEVLS